MAPFQSFPQSDEIVLVSCCNLRHGGSRYSVAVVTSAGIAWLDLDDAIDPQRDKGVTGIAATQEHCFLAIPGEHERLISLDSRLRVVDVFNCRQGNDLHSLAVHGDRLYFASTGCNQVLSVGCREGRFSGPERVHVTAAETCADRVHLNSLQIDAAGDLKYTMFGVGPRSPVRDSGAVVAAASGRVLADGLWDPHSLTRLRDGRLAFCESLHSALCVIEPGTPVRQCIRLRGYTRGIAQTGRHLVVAASHWRSRSRSSAQLRCLPHWLTSRHGHHGKQSHLFFLNADLDVERCVEFTPYATEIYDVAYLGRGFQPAAVFTDAIERRRLAC